MRKLAGDDPAKQMLAMLDVMDIWFNDPDFHGCIFLNAAAEFSDPRDPIHQAAAGYKRRVRDDLRDLAKLAGATNAERFADELTLLIEGTLVVRHVHGRNDAARIARSSAERLLREFIPER